MRRSPLNGRAFCLREACFLCSLFPKMMPLQKTDAQAWSLTVRLCQEILGVWQCAALPAPLCRGLSILGAAHFGWLLLCILEAAGRCPRISRNCWAESSLRLTELSLLSLSTTLVLACADAYAHAAASTSLRAHACARCLTRTRARRQAHAHLRRRSCDGTGAPAKTRKQPCMSHALISTALQSCALTHASAVMRVCVPHTLAHACRCSFLHAALKCPAQPLKGSFQPFSSSQALQMIFKGQEARGKGWQDTSCTSLSQFSSKLLCRAR